MMSQVETCPWQFSYASLGSQLILAKRIAPPVAAPFTPAPFTDEEAEAVRNVPPTPDEVPREPRVLPAPMSSAPALEGDALDEVMGQAIEAGFLPAAVGLQAPSTPIESSNVAGGALEVPMEGMDASSGVVHSRETAAEESERPSKQPRIFAVFEHEDDEHLTTFKDDDVDELESYDLSLDDELDAASDEVSDASLLKQLCFPYSTAEPQLSDSELLRIDTLADHLEISRLKAMGVLLSIDG